MKPLEPPDTHWLNAAQGWLMLGNPREAWSEFAGLRPESADHPEVLDLKWNLLAAQCRWQEAVVVAEHHLRLTPDEATGWVHRSFALHELRNTRAAFEQLLPALDLFPKEGIIPYNLACYTCQLGDLNAARTWLERALTTDKDKAMRRERLQTALEDADLKPLWPELREKITK